MLVMFFSPMLCGITGSTGGARRESVDSVARFGYCSRKITQKLFYLNNTCKLTGSLTTDRDFSRNLHFTAKKLLPSAARGANRQ